MTIKIASWIMVGSCSDNYIPAFLFEPTLDFLSTLVNKGNSFTIKIKNTNTSYDGLAYCTFDQATSFGECQSNLTTQNQYHVGFLKQKKMKPFPTNNGNFEF